MADDRQGALSRRSLQEAISARTSERRANNSMDNRRSVEAALTMLVRLLRG
jgi:hypothetical protein